MYSRKFGHVVLSRDAILALYILSSCVCLSVRPSLRSSDTSQYCIKAAKRRITHPTHVRHNRDSSLVYDVKDLGEIRMRSPLTVVPITEIGQYRDIVTTEG